jgi:cytochrome c553
MAQRMQACTACHGAEGRAAPDGYYPRIAGKPAGYLYNQLINFRDGHRGYRLMGQMLEPLNDAYLREMADYFAQLDLPYPAPARVTLSEADRRRGETLALRGDPALQVPACTQCHGAQLTGMLPDVPGLLGLPRDYLTAQMGAWRTGLRKGHQPDCMAPIAQRLNPSDVAAVSGWLASQPLPADTRPAQALAQGKSAALPPSQKGEGAAGGDHFCSQYAEPPAAPSPAAPPASGATTASTVKTTSTTIERGRYLSTLGNCKACHTVQGGAPYAGGRPIETPFGSVFSSNLTPSAAGLKDWSAEDFWRALHHGTSRNGRLLYPAFPYNNTTHIAREDSDALWAYFQSLPPAEAAPPEHRVRWPFNTQAALWVWRTLYFERGNTAQSPLAAAAPARASAGATAMELERGAYLVRGLGHCSACHAPRNALGANRDMLDLAGGIIPRQNWYAPSLNDVREAGVQDWPVEEIVALFQTGRSGGGVGGVGGAGQAAVVTGPMAEVVQHSTQHWKPEDLRAMALYLQSLPRADSAPGKGAPPSSSARSSQSANPGASLYRKHCLQCHGEQGQGVRTADGHFAYAPLAGNRTVTMASPANLLQTVLNGGFAPATAGHPRPFGMPPFVLALNDAEMAELLTYVRAQWGNQAPRVSELDVRQLRHMAVR